MARLATSQVMAHGSNARWRAHGGRSTCLRAITDIGMFVGMCIGMSLLLTAAAAVADAQDLPGFRRGDCNSDATVNLSDSTFLLLYMFGGSATPTCLDACDSDDSGDLLLGDVVFSLQQLFIGPPAFPAPALCGVDPTEDTLTCIEANCSYGVLSEDRAFTLETGRVGDDYVGDLPAFFLEEITWAQSGGPSNVLQPAEPFVSWSLDLDQQLPAGLSMDAATGLITGTPATPGSYTLSILAHRSNGEIARYTADLPIFSANESEIVANQPLSFTGPFLFTFLNDSFDYLHQPQWPLPLPLFNCLDQIPPPSDVLLTKELLAFIPTNNSQRLPIVFFHHGTGFSHDEYTDIQAHLASHGVVSVSVNDPWSFDVLPDFTCWGGHEEAAKVMFAVRDRVRQWDATPGHLMFEKVDWTRVFYAGHSRGGGVATVCAELDKNTRGVITLQGTDVRQDSTVGNTDRWISLPDVPVLNLSAEQDFDVVYPFAERLLERYRGPTTMVSIYGGCHGFSTSSSNNGCDLCDFQETGFEVDRCRYIRRDLQLIVTKIFCTAFLKRYGFGDISGEGLLHGTEFQASPYAAVAYRRNLGKTLRVDDFSAYPTNSLGFDNVVVDFPFVQIGSCYDVPFLVPNPIDAIQNLVMLLPPFGSCTLTSPLGTPSQPRDVSGFRKLTFRVKNHDIHAIPDNFGYGWLDLSATLADSFGNQATVLLDSKLPQMEFHPEPEPVGVSVRMKYQRFMTVTVPLIEFIAANPSLDLNSLLSLQFLFEVDGTQEQSPRMGLDDIQFE